LLFRRRLGRAGSEQPVEVVVEPPAQLVPAKQQQALDRDQGVRGECRPDHEGYCPYKGEAAYYSITPGGKKTVDAVWTYEAP
jgi:hypothetical protein